MHNCACKNDFENNFIMQCYSVQSQGNLLRSDIVIERGNCIFIFLIHILSKHNFSVFKANRYNA